MNIIFRIFGTAASVIFAWFTVLDWEYFFLFVTFLSFISVYRLVARHSIENIENEFFIMLLTYWGVFLTLYVWTQFFIELKG